MENEELETAPEASSEATEEAVEVEEVEYVEVDPVPLDDLPEGSEHFSNRAWLFREYMLGKRSMKEIAEQFGVDELKVKKFLVDFDIYDRTRP